MAVVSVDWTGSYPCLCMGEWIIVIDGIRLTGIGDDDFNTYGSYSRWWFDHDYDMVWESYCDGLNFEEWSKNPPNGLLESLSRHNIQATDDLLFQLYTEINSQDWRRSSCGGCS